MPLTDEIFVFDDAVSKNFQDAIETKIMDTSFPWYYVPNVSRMTTGENRLASDTVGLTHNFIDMEKGPMSFMTESLLPLLYECCAKINATPKQIYMGRIFMTIATGNTNHNLFHTDLNLPHLVCLYYVNDASGPTVILNKTHDDTDRDVVNANDQSKNIQQEVQPKKGRVVLFNGKFFHASTNPEKGRRCIINLDVGV